MITEEGEFKENASPKLIEIHQKIQKNQKQAERSFQKIIRDYQKKGWLSETLESFRSGRRVLSVPAEHKRKIKGIIHDESATGKTVFIEPDEIVFLNNELFDLENDKRREIYKLLAELSALLSGYADQFRVYFDYYIDLDLIQAKASFGQAYGGAIPNIKEDPVFNIKNGIHPLLLLSHQKKGKPVVPFDLDLKAPDRIVLISGPNAGGKTVLMKSVGLIQLMLQNGFLIPADPNSELGIVRQIFVEIGDQQSIDDDLSTYSSRLKNLNQVLNKADKYSLVLIDEFGSGTDPNVGGAIAEGILKSLVERLCFGIITTHYSNLKVFAFNSTGVVNASMLFDKNKLEPTFQFRVGNPGSSFAFEIAINSGLPKNLIQYAKKRIGKDEYSIDRLLIYLQDQKRKIDIKSDKLKTSEKHLEKLISNYEELRKELEYRRKKHKMEVKQQALQEISNTSRELNKMLKQLKKEKDLSKAVAKNKELIQKRSSVEKEVKALKQEVYGRESKNQKPVQVGDFVRLRNGTISGKILRIEKDKAELMMGSVRMNVPLTDLVSANEPLDIKTGQTINTELTDFSSKRNTSLDIRGYRAHEAERAITHFVENAFIHNINHLKILHGKGNGVLKKVVIDKLKSYKEIKSFEHPEEEYGGEGITLINL